MEMLNSISLLLANDLWINIISGIGKWIGNYGWTIIVFTILLKLILTPLDIGQRIASGKQSKVMSLMQPEMMALQAKYGDDKEKLNQEQAKLYKKYNVNLGGMCFTLALTMIITLVVTFTLYGSLRSFGEQNLYENYKSLDNAYVTAQANVDSSLSQEEKDEYIINIVKEEYDTQASKNSWLWVKNVWKSDTNTSQFVDFESFAKHYKLTDQEKEDAKVRYDVITRAINSDTGEVNGYFILIILAVLISFATQLLSSKLMMPKGQKMPLTNKIMMAVVPITMVILVTTSNVVYTLYVIINSMMSAIISTIISLIMKRKNKGDNNPEQVLKKMRNIQVVEYSRNYKK